MTRFELKGWGEEHGTRRFLWGFKLMAMRTSKGWRVFGGCCCDVKIVSVEGLCRKCKGFKVEAYVSNQAGTEFQSYWD
jgi:hypothetical protein